MIPKRAKPNEGGSVGIKIEVLTNMFKIIFDNKFVTNAVHYDVAIKPYKQSTEENGKKKGTQKELQLPKTLCRSIFEQFRNKHFNNRYPAYDGKKNAYSANDLPFDNDVSTCVDCNTIYHIITILTSFITLFDRNIILNKQNL